MMLILTVGAFAQRGPRAQGGNQAPATALKNALNLTDAQVSAIQALIQASQQQSKTIMTDLGTKRQTLNSLLNATSPNPTDIGNAALAVNMQEKQLKSLHDSLIAGIRNTLTSDQQATFDTLVKAGMPIPGLGGFGFRGPGGPGPHAMRGRGGV
jgi:Spy/CpxP family protein refolding chaperone